ncbi:hypothetical protein PN498_02385 [Oscillatoria sp. CS-180]|nr:hypothetical protein [Oscillatoria sp. CS-180]MDB9524823.1 hypothetical protein [Oscillatoria sp. CS-180]
MGAPTHLMVATATVEAFQQVLCFWGDFSAQGHWGQKSIETS